MIAFLKAHWPYPTVIVLLLISFAFGRYSKKPVTVTKTVEHVVTNTVTVQAEAKTLHETKTVVVYRDRVIHKDGTVEEKSETQTTDGVATQDDKNTTTTVAKTADRTDTPSNTTSSASAYPNWHANLLAGVGFSPALYPVVGVQVERRILGPIYIGAWGVVNPITGSGLTVGVSAGVAF